MLRSVLSSQPGIWGPERHQHGPPLWRRRTHAAVTADRLSAGTPKGTLHPGLTCLQETEDHTAQEAVAHGGGGAGGGPSGLSVDERERGLQGVLLRCHCPCQAQEPICHSGAMPLPPEAQIRNDPEREVHNGHKSYTLM